MEHAKASTNPTLASGGRRTVLFHNQARTLYDIYHIHYTAITQNLGFTDERLNMALSLRGEDQVEDVAVVSAVEMTRESGIYALFSLTGDLITPGGLALVLNHDLAFTKPFPVPFTAFIINALLGTAIDASVEVWYERRTVSTITHAEAVAQTGGRARTS